MYLQERNQPNFDVQMANCTSVRATRAYDASITDGTIPLTTTDIGKKLTAFYAYTPQVVAPILPKLMEYILEEREKRNKVAEKKEEEKTAKEKGSKLEGSMRVDPSSRPAVSTPNFMLATIKYRMHPSLFWFIDSRLHYVMGTQQKCP
ncbi:hypothetical protein C8R44DRAFT_745382 [Mycena epipterygia]|nr:hypothetical protein C8R44DRAFT_745382 [Mycena epipterygia]